MVLQRDPNASDAAQARALAVVARWRAGGGDPQALLRRRRCRPRPLPPLPASTTFLTLDREGNAVACALTMDNLFGTGRVVPGMGFLLAASPAVAPLPLSRRRDRLEREHPRFPRGGRRLRPGGRGARGGASAMMNTLRSDQPMPVPVPEPGRANVIACSRYLPGSERSCAWATDPRGFGLAPAASELE